MSVVVSLQVCDSTIGALFRLDVESGNRPFIFAPVWVLGALWILTGLMGPGVREMIMLQILPVVFLASAVPVALTVWWKTVSPNYKSNRTVRFMIPCACSTGMLLLFSIDPLETLAFHFPALAILFSLVATWYTIHWLLHTMYRRLEQNAREAQRHQQEDVFWRRLDKCMTQYLRCFGALILFCYVGFVLTGGLGIVTDIYGYIQVFLMGTIGCGALLYLVVAALMVRGELSFSARRGDEITGVAIRQAQQIVWNPNDPLAQPLLLV